MKRFEPVSTAYRVGARCVRALPRPVATGAVAVGSSVAARVLPARRMLIERNLRRAYGSSYGGRALQRSVVENYRSYGRYWVDSFRLPDLTPEQIDGGFSYEGVERIVDARARGIGPILVLPHLGGWEWAGFWLTEVLDVPVTVVVEPLEPPELLDFFTAFRRELGMNIVPLGPSAGAEVLRAIKDRHVVCLLADRDIQGDGVRVEFFGETTTLPGGPATLAVRTGAPLLPAAVYFQGRGHHAVVAPEVPATRTGRLRDDVARITQELAASLERLIRTAPEQWHLQQPNWPSDHEALVALGRPGRDHAAGG